MFTQYQRNIIADLRKNAKASTTRGNILWLVNLFDEVECHLVEKDKHTVYRESDSPPHLSCPKKFLDETECVNKEWRDQVYGYLAKMSDWRTTIGEMFKNKKDGEIVRVVLQATKPDHRLSVDQLDIEIVETKVIAGRGHNGFLYKVPFSKIKEVLLIPAEALPAPQN